MKYRCKPVEVDAIRFREAKQRVFDGGAPEWVRKAVDGHVVEFFPTLRHRSHTRGPRNVSP